MPDIAAVLKAEISRLAKKEAKVATSQLKRASVQHRNNIAQLRKLIGQQAKAIAHLKKQTGQPQAAEEPTNGVRFSGAKPLTRSSGSDVHAAEERNSGLHAAPP